MQIVKLLIAGAVGLFLSDCTLLKHYRAKGDDGDIAVNLAKGPDSMAKVSVDTSKKNKPKPYRDVITAGAKSDIGLFTVHRIKERYYFEIPDSLLERDILVVSRIARAAADGRTRNLMHGYAGDQIGESVIRFCEGPSDKLFVRLISYSERSLDSSENGLFRTLLNSNLQPIHASFNIEAYTPDSLGILVDVTEFISSDNPLLYFDGLSKKDLQLGAFQKDKSYIASLQSFPMNVELLAMNTYAKQETTATYEINASFVLLPKIPMQARYADSRIGYFFNEYIDFDVSQRAEPSRIITRWRLEPKDQDCKKYLEGELVEPKRPIVFYIDPATPKKWVPFLIQGVNDWQQAFEKAGFKNAIYALEVPEDDPEFSLLDARHNAIIYKPSVVANASGPHVHDPRSGEIMETHINWYHNVMELLHDWYMVQAAPNDPRAQKMEFDDELMGQLIRFVCSHEVGHTLGLMHNFGSSSTIPVDSLRSKTYVESNGFCPSIMDYARFNYVAQPEDSISINGIFPHIGVYDKWAIEWGYRWLPHLIDKDEEKAYMNQWVLHSLEKDKRLYYGPQGMVVGDPRNQAEDLGDDAMKAGYYGIQNLKRVMSHLTEWTKETNADYSGLKRMNDQVINQFLRYLMHVTYNIGLYTWTYKTQEQKGSIIGFVPREKQKEAVAFLQEHIFDTPHWLMNHEIFSKVGGWGYMLPNLLRTTIFDNLLYFYKYLLMQYGETEYPENAYTFDELLTDLEDGIWKELKDKRSIDFDRRMLQKQYAERLIYMHDPVKGGIIGMGGYILKSQTDFYPILQKHIRSILDAINKALPGYKDKKSKQHLMVLKDHLEQSLEPTDISRFLSQPITPPAGQESHQLLIPPYPLTFHPWKLNKRNFKGCWEVEILLYSENLSK